MSPETPAVAVSGSNFCPGDDVIVNVTGAVNDGVWKVTTGGCGGTQVGLFSGNTIVLNPSATTTYTIQGIIESGCGPSSNCVDFTVDVFTESTPFTGFTVDPDATIVCPNDVIFWTCTGGVDGEGAFTRWYTEPDGAGVLYAVGNPINISVASPLTYHVRREGTCNTTASIPVTITYSPDPNPPVITCPANISVTNTDPTCEPMTIDIGTATATDVCTFSISNNAPAVYPEGETTVVWTADQIGDTSSCEQLVTVTCCIAGCDDISACNFDPSATCNDGSCVLGPCFTCPGDFNLDGVVDAADLLQFLGAFGTTCDTPPCLGDLNDDAVIDAADLLFFLGIFGSVCP